MTFKELKKGQTCEFRGHVYKKVSKVMRDCCNVDHNAINIVTGETAYIQEQQEVVLIGE